ncbi:RICIN domain-containing protein [Catenulispora pinisilvae]|uniref:RICIN domain-containing protein n=1 Tax=Catenulispora pinisilvae TaxID=2705253 RepID=UPI00189230A1|nr:RICIN domain-containing protein [Catenulispora pinisilvae]
MSEGSTTTGGVWPARVPRAVRRGRGSGAAVSSAVLVAVIVAGVAACSSGAGNAGASAAAAPSLTTTGTVTGTTTIAEPVPASSAGAPSSSAAAAPSPPSPTSVVSVGAGQPTGSAPGAAPSQSPHSTAKPPPRPSPSLSMGPATPFENTHSGQCLGRTSDVPGTPLSTAACGTAASLGWSIASDGTIRVGGLCMDAVGTQGGALVQLAGCGTDPAEQFVFSDGELVNTRAAKCVDDEFKGTQVRLQRCDAGTAQIWRHL